MSSLFEGEESDSDFEIKTNSEYAKNYDNWRKKEEINKLKTKYGEDSEESSSESDDEEIELTEKTEKDFFKVLACLKSKDPKIYDENVTFFDDEDKIKIKNQKNKPLYIKDYERKLIVEKEGVLSDEESDISKFEGTSVSHTPKQEKDNVIKSLNALDEEEDEQWGGFVKRETSEKKTEQDEYKQWLTGQTNQLQDKKVEMELKPLKDYWNKSDLDEGEKFVRDYILHNKFLDKNQSDYIPTYDEIVHDSEPDLSNDEETIEKQEEFEHKYNFRFEEPDEEFIKRYPRTIENSLRRQDDKRKLKRQEIKERKKKEKEEKMQDLKKLQELKCKEIEEKLEKLKEITGNAKLGFDDEDLEGDFDPEKYDQKMKLLFDKEFYEGAEGDQKPEFPDIDEELEIENYQHFEQEDYIPHCEDEEFNMDADYDPNSSFKKEFVENAKSQKKRKRKSKFAEAVNKPKPKFDPNNKTYEEYFDEYYKLDCEDFIGNIPCRFKYRKVIPNDFGLTTEEILMAKDRELNKWCSLKKAVQIRPDHVEKYDQIAYNKKAQNITLKKKILPSLFNTDVETENLSPIKNTFTTREENNDEIAINKQEDLNETAKVGQSSNDNLKKKKTVKRKQNNDTIAENKQKIQKSIENLSNSQEGNINSEKKKLDNKNKNSKKKKRKVKLNKKISDNQNISMKNAVSTEKLNNKKRKRGEYEDIGKRQKKLKKTEIEKNPILAISDQRLAAFGIKPKKFRNKLKYKTV